MKSLSAVILSASMMALDAFVVVHQKKSGVAVKTSCRQERRPMSGDSSSETTKSSSNTETLLDNQVTEKFKIITCMSTSCSKKRKALNMDPLATYGAFFERIEGGRAPDVQLEEGPCLGSCKMAPCVSIEHEDYMGTVSLEGMTPQEFQASV
jgi:hypothetical protein